MNFVPAPRAKLARSSLAKATANPGGAFGRGQAVARCGEAQSVGGRWSVVGGRLLIDLVPGYRQPSTHYPLLPTRYWWGRADGGRPLHVAARRTLSADRSRWSVADGFWTWVSLPVYSLPATAYALLRCGRRGRSEGVRPLHVAAWRNRSVDGGRWSVADGFGTGVTSTVCSLPATAYALLVDPGAAECVRLQLATQGPGRQ